MLRMLLASALIALSVNVAAAEPSPLTNAKLVKYMGEYCGPKRCRGGEASFQRGALNVTLPGGTLLVISGGSNVRYTPEMAEFHIETQENALCHKHLGKYEAARKVAENALVAFVTCVLPGKMFLTDRTIRIVGEDLVIISLITELQQQASIDG